MFAKFMLTSADHRALGLRLNQDVLRVEQIDEGFSRKDNITRARVQLKMVTAIKFTSNFESG